MNSVIKYLKGGRWGRKSNLRSHARQNKKKNKDKEGKPADKTNPAADKIRSAGSPARNEQLRIHIGDLARKKGCSVARTKEAARLAKKNAGITRNENRPNQFAAFSNSNETRRTYHRQNPRATIIQKKIADNSRGLISDRSGVTILGPSAPKPRQPTSMRSTR